MNRISVFYKVSYEQFKKDVLLSCNCNIDDARIKEMWDNIKLPTRATAGSAGYDFYIPFDTEINDTWQVIPTGVRCFIAEGWMLGLFPKSGLGFKYNMRLANTIGIVDADFFNANNEGHIMAKVSCGKECYLEAGSKFIQGVFLPFGITTDDECSGVRTGGFGSTGA